MRLPDCAGEPLSAWQRCRGFGRLSWGPAAASAEHNEGEEHKESQLIFALNEIRRLSFTLTVKFQLKQQPPGIWAPESAHLCLLSSFLFIPSHTGGGGRAYMPLSLLNCCPPPCAKSSFPPGLEGKMAGKPAPAPLYF